MFANLLHSQGPGSGIPEPFSRLYHTDSLDTNSLNSEDELLKEYGDSFCDTVGINCLLGMAELTPASLYIPSDQVMNTNPIQLQDLGENRAIKGKDSEGRPFIAFKVAVYNQNYELLYHCVELIYARTSYNTDFFVSPLHNKCDDGITRPSHFYKHERCKDFDCLTDFFNEKKIQTTIMPSDIYIKWA